jgi:hypothetical protein
VTDGFPHKEIKHVKNDFFRHSRVAAGDIEHFLCHDYTLENLKQLDLRVFMANLMSCIIRILILGYLRAPFQESFFEVLLFKRKEKPKNCFYCLELGI